MRASRMGRAGLLAFILWSGAAPADAFNQPPVNLCTTSFLDGGAPPGFYYIDFLIATRGDQALDADGREILPGARVDVLVNLNQFYWITGKRVLGGTLALDLLVPVVAPTARGLSANTLGLGDLVIGPALHWDGGTLLGRPVFHRVEVDVTFPTGKYDKAIAVNPGANLLTVEPYYSFVWFFRDKWETSWRVFYAVHGENDETKMKPGQLLHANWAFSRRVAAKWRVGAAGYGLWQTTEDEANGVKVPRSEERAYAAGPGLIYLGPGLTLMLSHPVEFGVRNRFRGSRTTLELIHRF
jgi:hypothetical protein